ncbi:hypothetical protein DPMN_028107 [Dreissena polymorpha]|uniref:Uncharacterized protein n=1 Tax=Dreissena polymorpha TaxID=45954 RepID=A0A9D4LWL7_DREPO|nr:hypothetical protein DPMN_028107 [Dreissena polymorpha]
MPKIFCRPYFFIRNSVRPQCNRSLEVSRLPTLCLKCVTEFDLNGTAHWMNPDYCPYVTNAQQSSTSMAPLTGGIPTAARIYSMRNRNRP